MKQKHLMTLLSVVALIVSSFMIAGNVGAMYQSDGAVQNGTTGGWTAPDDGICVLGLHADGTMDVDTTIKTARDCQARLIPVTAVASNDTLANVCGNSSKNSANVKYAAPGSSTCVTTSGGYISGSYSLVNLDRNATMCTALGGLLANNAAVKNTANGTAATCVAYGWQYRGMDTNVNDATYGQPNAFGSIQYPLSNGGASGTDNTLTPNVGLCYTSMRTTLPVASCPTVVGSTSGTANSSASAAFGYSVSGTTCLYAYGISGTVNAALNNTAGTAVYAAGATANLAQYTTLGACLANGGTWSNWIPDGTAATVGPLNGITSAVTFDLTREAVNSDNGCLHCHSTLSQQNGDVYRQKDSYLMTGHKNMLRKVTPGMAWAGPNGIYTTDGTNALNWGIFGVPGSATDGTNPMYYIYGDWMAMYPTVAITGSNYSCANCHSTGFSGGTAATPGVESIGTPGYTGTQPADAGANYVAAVKAGYKWDIDGINCSRCHAATVAPVTQTMISGGTCKNGATDVTTSFPTQSACSAATYTWTAIGTPSSFPTTRATNSGMGNLPSGTGINNLCFGCHQSIAKNYLAQGGSASGTAQFDPTLIPTGLSHGASWGRDFNGHVLGNSFLNSVHARYTGAQSGNGSITANALGENDLTDPNGATEYSSTFKGYTCYQGPSGVDVALTDAQGNALNSMAKCNAVYGAGSWRIDTNGAQGTCTTCHDVHNSLFVASQASKAIKKGCTDCHNNSDFAAAVPNAPQVAQFNHPQSPGTPFDTSLYPNGSCEVCHMATQAVANGNQNSMPVHVWRISTDPNYSTWPTSTQFSSGTDRNAQVAPESYLNAAGTAVGGTYPKAVWVDVNMACGQCHGGDITTSSGAPDVHNGAPYKSKLELASDASNMHYNIPTVAFTSQQGVGGNDHVVTFDASQSTVCPSGSCTYTWNFGDTAIVGGGTGTGATTTHTYSGAVPGANTFSSVLTVINATSTFDTGSQSVQVNIAPTVAETSFGATNVSPYMTVNLQDSSTAGSSITVNWGDGSPLSTGSAGGLFTHTYTKINTYTVVHAASVGGIIASENLSITVPVKSPVSGNVTSKAGVPLQSVSLTLKLNGVTKGITSTDASGNFTFINITPGTYTVTAAKAGYTFASPAATLTVATGAVTGVNFSSSN